MVTDATTARMTWAELQALPDWPNIPAGAVYSKRDMRKLPMTSQHLFREWWGGLRASWMLCEYQPGSFVIWRRILVVPTKQTLQLWCRTCHQANVYQAKNQPFAKFPGGRLLCQNYHDDWELQVVPANCGVLTIGGPVMPFGGLPYEPWTFPQLHR